MPDPIYLDNNATTRPLPEVIETVAEASRIAFANPGSRHGLGRQARQILEDSRESIAKIIDCDPSELIFTSGGTESINLALFGFATGPRRKLVRPAGEHPATVEATESLRQRGWGIAEIALDGAGRFAPASLDAIDWTQVGLATSLLAHNETGVIQDLAPLAARCREQRVPLHIDALQAVGKMPVSFRELGCAALSFGAHKFHGPRGVGGLVICRGWKPTPLQFGGFQEHELRPGTEPVALVAGMAKALELWSNERDDRTARMTSLRDRFESSLAEKCGPIVINGSEANRLPNTSNIAFPGLDGEALLVTLDLEGIACSLGSACKSGSVEPSPVLVAMGLTADIYNASVRFSLGADTSEAEIDEAVSRIAGVVASLRAVEAAV
ncbi:cysteine desulfurase family protein [Stratiformator vulcanicus]|uniref:Cysteine desulfurase n=1 Tax=Stratiformator vulcanicus TaxID=2527980 RepID=A0A517R7S8_9PLAN|nr:cysteine desulfurase family protein [Stratiformator vulcanicus]QDT39946.1 Cysteine desulfurase [Stratiformator vulcanicus]